MNFDPQRLEDALDAHLRMTVTPETPETLVRALRHAVFPGGGRLRPMLVLAVASALGVEYSRSSALACAVSIEMVHCASLVHDDLPCFDNALLRRGVPTVQHQFGEAMAVLVGDGLILAGFEALARDCLPSLLPQATMLLAAAAGAGRGLVAGQSWELDPREESARTQVGLVTRYHEQKTGALFRAACEMGAVVGGASPQVRSDFANFGMNVGRLYQQLDDLLDVIGDAAALGKPVGQDVRHSRPTAMQASALVRDVHEATQSFFAELQASIPRCKNPEILQQLLVAMQKRTQKMLPAELRRAS